jgi:uncharacterized RDD family membrane protein YckC
MSSAAQHETQDLLATGTEGAPVRQLAAERLAAHRSRRAQSQQAAAQSAALAAQLEAQTAVRQQARRSQPASRVRDAVAERYKQSPSYQEFLAAEAERALQQARAEAEIAARNAIAVAEAQRQLLAEIEQWNQPEPAPLLQLVPAPAKPATGDWHTDPLEPETPASTSSAELTVQLGTLHGALKSIAPHFDSEMWVKPGAPGLASETWVRSNHATESSPELAHALAELDQEIAFRLAPHFAEPEPAVAPEPIPANIIEFPRQLVASRKARPRLAEGPLRADGTPEPQLRIFEVEPELISVEPAAALLAPDVIAAAPEWQGLLLSAPPSANAAAFAAEPVTTPAPELVLHAPPVQLRLMAFAVDAACLFAAMLAFTAVVGWTAGPALGHTLHTLPKLQSFQLFGGATAASLLVFTLLFRQLFFTLNDATPGMRFARLAFCTFQEESPSRRAIRRRLFSTLLAVTPLGLGLLWIAMDPDRLGWHDRLSKMYPRHY